MSVAEKRSNRREEILSFSLEIEKIVKDKSMGYTDSIIYYCEKVGLELEIVPRLLSSNLKTKIQREAESINAIEKSKTRKLPTK